MESHRIELAFGGQTYQPEVTMGTLLRFKRLSGIDLIRVTQDGTAEEALSDLEPIAALICALLQPEEPDLTPMDVADRIRITEFDDLVTQLAGISVDPEAEGEQRVDPPMSTPTPSPSGSGSSGPGPVSTSA